jgi:hypothetical protein
MFGWIIIIPGSGYLQDSGSKLPGKRSIHSGKFLKGNKNGALHG